MSQSIWTRCAGASELRGYEAGAWRVVEAQHLVGTRKLVDSAEEQDALEALLDAGKPPLPAVEGVERLHYLLFTPFRYPPLRYGSRFGTRAERGILYGSERLPTAFAEVAYYRLVFLAGTEAELGPVMTELSAFRAAFGSDSAVDLTAPPFEAWADSISSPVDYAETQALGRDMRADGVTLARYRSARDRRHGVNIAVFSPSAILHRSPRGFETWLCTTTPERVEMTRKHLLKKGTHCFLREGFEVDGRLPVPAT